MRPRNYVEWIMGELERELGEHECLPSLLRCYALLVLTTGVNTKKVDIHDAWACWKAPHDPSHRSLVPFDRLTPEVQALDAPYVEAIRVVAQRWLRDGQAMFDHD